LKPILPIVLAAALLTGTASARLPAPPKELESVPVALLVDLGSGQVLYARKPKLQFAPASMTKVMTAYVAFEELASGKLSEDQMLVVRPATSREWKGKGTSMYLDAGDTVSVRDLLRGIMTASANDASVVLAEGHAGSVSGWSALMNDAASRLSMNSSRFNTPSGWPDGGKTYVSARDLVTLSNAMISRFPELYRVYAGNKSFAWRDRVLTSYDPVTGVVAGADGIKTGYTKEAGYNFLGSAERDGRRLVMVVGGARSMDQRDIASRAFLEWGFAAWQARPLFRKGETVATAKVQQGDARQVALIASKDIHAAVPQDETSRISLKVIYPGPLNAPVAMGDEVAELEISVDGMAPSRIPLRAARDIGSAGLMDRLWNGLMNLFA